jgi:hypothetical protein
MSDVMTIANESLQLRRRFFRFRLRTLLMLPILFAAVWWWLSWPEPSADKFVNLLSAGDVEAARSTIDGPQPSDAFWGIVTSGKFKLEPAKFRAASWQEYLQAQRQFDFDWQYKDHSRGMGPFIISRNRVRLDPLADSRIFLVAYVLHDGDPKVIAANLAALYPKDNEHLIKADAQKNRVLVGGSPRTHSEISALTVLAEDAPRP